MIASPRPRGGVLIGTSRASGLSLLVRRKLSPACLTRANTSPRWRAASVEVIDVSMRKNVKYIFPENKGNRVEQNWTHRGQVAST